MLTDSREGGREGEKEGEKQQLDGETIIGCLLDTPNWGPNPQPRDVPDRNRPVTFWFTGYTPTNWATGQGYNNNFYSAVLYIDPKALMFSLPKIVTSVCANHGSELCRDSSPGACS